METVPLSPYPQTQHRWKQMHRLLTLALTLSLTIGPLTPTYAQDSTSSKSTTLNGEQIAVLVDRACQEARDLADEADGLRVERDTFERQFNQCNGALAQWQGIDAQRLELVRQLARVEIERDSMVRRFWVVVGIAGGLVAGGLIAWGVGKF